VQKSVTETNCYAEQLKNSRGNIFCKQSRINEWQPVTATEIYVVLAFFMLMGIVQKPSLRLHFSLNRLVDHLKFRIDLAEGLLVKYKFWGGKKKCHKLLLCPPGVPFERRKGQKSALFWWRTGGTSTISHLASGVRLSWPSRRIQRRD